MSTEPPNNTSHSNTSQNNTSQTNSEPEQSLPIEEMIPLVKSDPNRSSEVSPSSESAQTEAPTEDRPPTPAEMDCHECRSCGYTYEPTKGDNRSNILAGIEFQSLPKSWRCPVCGASRTQFSNIGPAGTASGFKANLSYGFGVNTLTPGQKNILIFGALGLGVLFFLSLYGLQ